MPGEERFMSDTEPEEDGKQNEFVKQEMASVAKWDAKGVSVDSKMLDGRKANRGFTIAMGKTGEADVGADFMRKDKRAQTLPAQTIRRGDHILSEASQKEMNNLNEVLMARYRRGSVSVVATVISDEEFLDTWKANCKSHTFGIMTEGQSHSDERERQFYPSDLKEIPGAKKEDMPPIVSCHKGSKGFRDTTPNQDNFSVTHFKNGWSMACAFDGHGPYGHIVSTRTVQSVPYYVTKHLTYNKDKPWSNPEEDVPAVMIEAFEKAQKELVTHAIEKKWDVQASGSTAVACMWKDDLVFCANAGDSRCVIGYQTKRSVIHETEDHKPNTPAEQKRIEEAGGKVEVYEGGEGAESRLFDAGMEGPGLAMSRAIGDLWGHECGMIHVPDVQSEKTAGYDFFCCGSDGVWDFVSNEEVTSIIYEFGRIGASLACDKIMKLAWSRWEEEGDVVDDISFVIVWLPLEEVFGAPSI